MSPAFNRACAISVSWRSIRADSFKTRAFSSGQQCRDVGFRDALFQRAARVKKTGACASDTGPRGSLTVAAFAADLNQLADGGNGIVIALPKAVAQRRAAFASADFGGGNRSGGIGKFLGDDELRLRRVNAAFGREQIPVALEGKVFCVRERKCIRRRRSLCASRGVGKTPKHRREQQPRRTRTCMEQCDESARLIGAWTGVPHIRRGINLA